MDTSRLFSLAHLRQFAFLIDRRTRLGAIGLLVLTLLGAALEAVGIGLVFVFIKLITSPDFDSYAATLSAWTGGVWSFDSADTKVFVAVSLLAVFVLKNAILLAVIFVQNRFLSRNNAILSHRLFELYMTGDYALHLGRNSAEFLRTVNGVSTVFDGVLMGFITFFSEILVVLLVSMVLFAAEPTITFVAIAALGTSVGLFYLAAKRRLTAWGVREQVLAKELIKSLQQGLHSLKETTVLGRTDFVANRFRKFRDELSWIDCVSTTLRYAPRLWVETVMVACVLGAVIVILIDGKDPQSVIPALTLFAAAAFRLVPSMARILFSLTTMKQNYAIVDLVYADLKTFGDSIAPRAHRDHAPLSFTTSIKFDNVSYAYPGSETLALKNIDLEIKVGASVGLVGPSGAGKTTLVDIMLGLLSPSKGRILVDGTDIASAMQAWRKQIGYVPQTVYINDDTLRRNIAYGIEDDLINDESVSKALRLAQLDEVVIELPDGLDTIVGERGVRLSGGQVQRIGIARALYLDPPILIFDEATSSLDNETEFEISNAIDRLRGDKTMIIIAHRLSTVRKCDRLLFIHDGEVVDDDTFDGLTEKNKDFGRLVDLATL